jgi:GSH-dependent disulfide-bond oxidoreductase
MIELHTWSTPNGRKISIALEELGLPYRVHPVDITRNQQFDPAFLRISPNNKIPAIVDTDTGTALMESGAILLYLADKTGRLLPDAPAARWRALEWLMWQMGGFGPMLGQAHHFVHFNPDKSAYATARYRDEAARLYRVLDTRLARVPWLAGEDYSVADIAVWPWAARWEWQGVALTDYPAVLRWYREMAARPAVVRGYAIPNPAPVPLP